MESEGLIPQAGLELESRARSAGFSVMEIGNRKKYLTFPYEFPGPAAQRNPDFEK